MCIHTYTHTYIYTIVICKGICPHWLNIELIISTEHLNDDLQKSEGNCVT